jgi:hypothetical protein
MAVVRLAAAAVFVKSLRFTLPPAKNGMSGDVVRRRQEFKL